MIGSQLHVGDVLTDLFPSTCTKDEIEDERRRRNKRTRRPGDRAPMRAVVEYIHPERRYAVVRFVYEIGSFCETVCIGKEVG